MDLLSLFSWETFGQGKTQLDELFLAFVLSSLIGLERERRLKSAGLRTHALVGLGAALMMLVSKYGFADIIVFDNVGLDPSRVAAQIVSGIGFIGGGLIFVRKDIVHGLTTAATVWLTAGVGMACGGGLPILALAATVGHFVVVFGYTRLINWAVGDNNRLHIRYNADSDVAEKVLALCKAHKYVTRGFTVKTETVDPKITNLIMRIQGRFPVTTLSGEIMKMDHVLSVTINRIEAGE